MSGHAKREYHHSGTINKMIVQPCSYAVGLRDGDSSVPMIRSHVKKLEVAEIKICRWACGHILRYRVRNDDIRETGGKVYHRTCRKARLRCSLET